MNGVEFEISIKNCYTEQNLINSIKNVYDQQTILADWLYAKARVYENLDSLEYAKKMYKESVIICEKHHYDYLLSKNFIGLKFISYKQNNYKDALKYSFSSLKPLDKIGNSEELAKSYNMISSIYGRLGENEKARKYEFIALNIALSINNLNLASLMYCNIGIDYHEQGYKNKSMYDSALFYANKSLEIAEKINDNERKITALSLIGSCYLNTNELQKSFEILHRGLSIANSLNDNYYKITLSDHIGELYQKKGNADSAIYYGQKSLTYAKELNLLSAVQWSAENLSKSYQLKGDFKKAFEMQKLFYESRDSILSEENQKELISQELKFKYDKLAISDSLKYDADKKITDFKNQEALNSERGKIIYLSLGLIIAVGLGFVAFNRFRVTQKQKIIIEQQKLTLEDKTKEVQDSIFYSKEIQEVFLKPLTGNLPYLSETALFYKPKDIVSGDFYWHKEIGDNLIIAVGDCTGHGVPGAIISVLAIQCLEKSVIQLGNANELHGLNTLLREDFDNYYNQNKRVIVGLDYSVICLNKKDKKIYVSGSGATVLFKKKDSTIKSLKFNSINIGGAMPIIYEPQTHVFEYHDIDSIYMYTDGIVDQRGGQLNKKLGTQKFISLLEKAGSIKTSSLVSSIETELTNWINDQAQMDDMTLLCLKL